MRITCPACNAAYQVPDAQLTEGRVVRCVRCGTDWTPLVATVPDDEPEPEPEVLPEPEVVPAVVPASRRMALDDDKPPPVPAAPMVVAAPVRRGGALLLVAWVLSVAVVGAACAGLVVRREAVMAAWPASVRGYAALGLR